MERVFITKTGFIVIEPDSIIEGNIPAQYTSREQAAFLEGTTNATEKGSYLVIAGLIVG